MKNFDPFKPIKFPIKILKVLGMYQKSNSSWLYRFYGFLMHFVAVELYFVWQWVYLVWMIDNVEELSDLLSLLITHFGMFFKLINFMYKIEKFEALLRMFDELFKFSASEDDRERTKLRKQTKSVQNLFKAFWMSGLFAVSSAACLPFFYSKEHRLPYNMWFPVDYKKSRNWFYALTLYQISQGYSFCCVVVSLDMLPVFFMSAANGLLEELSERLERIGSDRENNPKNDQKDLNELLKCIEIHLKIKHFTKATGEMFSTTILIQGLLSSILLCSTAFSLSLVSLDLISQTSELSYSSFYRFHP